LRIRLIQKPRHGCIDGVDVDRFEIGMTYEVGNVIAAVFLSERWAVPVASDEPAVVIPLSELPPRQLNTHPPVDTADDAARKDPRRPRQ